MRVDFSVSAAALHALVEPVLMTDAEGCLVFANATAVRVFAADAYLGRPVGELLARYPVRTPDGAVLPPALHPISRALAQHQAVIGAELTFALESGPATYLVNTVPLLNGDAGEAGGTVAVFHDVTAARRLEREAAEHAARLQALVDLVNEAIFILGADGQTLFVNALAREQMGDPARESLSPTARARVLDFAGLDGRRSRPRICRSPARCAARRWPARGW